MSISDINLKSEVQTDLAKVTLTALHIAWLERLHITVFIDDVCREQPEHLQLYFMERLQYYRQLTTQQVVKNIQEYETYATE